jgi:HK97 gp10 family phage protein
MGFRLNMAEVQIKGFEDLRRETENICKDVLDRAIKAAEDAAAEVIKKAVEASAPRRTGQLAGNIIVYESIDRKALAGSGRKRLLVGPEKRKGFYGYFYNFGRKGQPARPWFETASASVEAQAMEAGIAAFQAVIQQELGR